MFTQKNIILFPIVLSFKLEQFTTLDNLRARVVPKNPRNHPRISRNPLTREILLFVTRSAQSYFKPLLGPLDGNAHENARGGRKKAKYVEKYHRVYRGISISRKKGVRRKTYKVASMPRRNVYSTRERRFHIAIMKGIPAQDTLASCLVFEFHLKRFHSAQFAENFAEFSLVRANETTGGTGRKLS